MMARRFKIALRSLFFALGLFSLIAQTWDTAIADTDFLHNPDKWINFFSYFTISSNVLFTLWYGFGVIAEVRKKSIWLGALPFVQGTLLLSGAVTVAVYWALLSDAYHPASWLGTFAMWSFHLFIPLGIWIDWLLYPGNRQPRFSIIFLWLLYPLLYLTYSLVRGFTTAWYPYFFLNPARTGGLEGLVLWILGLTGLFFILGLGLWLLYKKLGKASNKKVLA